MIIKPQQLEGKSRGGGRMGNSLERLFLSWPMTGPSSACTMSPLSHVSWFCGSPGLFEWLGIVQNRIFSFALRSLCQRILMINETEPRGGKFLPQRNTGVLGKGVWRESSSSLRALLNCLMQHAQSSRFPLWAGIWEMPVFKGLMCLPLRPHFSPLLLLGAGFSGAVPPLILPALQYSANPWPVGLGHGSFPGSFAPNNPC